MESFLLNMKLLNDTFCSAYKHVTLFAGEDPARLEAVRFYQKGLTLRPSYIYLLYAEELDSLPAGLQGLSFLVAGKLSADSIPCGCSLLVIEDEASIPELFNLAQDTFERYAKWNQELYAAMKSPHPLDAMLEASLKVFQNPIFIHDTNFYILSCTHRAPNMLVWDKDARTGWNIVPLSLIHDFKVDPEYLSTLTTTKACVYSAEQRGYPILYMNLWNNGRYEGRICVDELETPILPGQFLLITHLAKLILQAIQNNSLFYSNMGNDIEQFFREYLDGNIQDQSIVMKMLQFLDWKQDDHYLCLRLETGRQNIRMLSSAATLGHIETQIPEGHAFMHSNGITVLVNLTYSHTRISDVLSSLAILLREGLLKMGASSEIYDFLQLSQGYYQARMALELGKKSGSMNWCCRFDDYILEYLLGQGGEHLSPELLCSNKLLILRQYDEKNKTELYHTLKVYLDLERNVLQTSKTLFIHRSTLFYRLERIQKLADIDYEDPRERLILQLSFQILEQRIV